jgi:3-deoxy-D-manno-octulosonic-acid transferase
MIIMMIPRDVKESEKWIRLAAEEGFSIAQRSLGHFPQLHRFILLLTVIV